VVEPTPTQRRLLHDVDDLLRRAVEAAVEANNAAWERRVAAVIAEVRIAKPTEWKPGEYWMGYYAACDAIEAGLGGVDG
jgi:hypothetical protein